MTNPLRTISTKAGRRLDQAPGAADITMSEAVADLVASVATHYELTPRLARKLISQALYRNVVRGDLYAQIDVELDALRQEDAA